MSNLLEVFVAKDYIDSWIHWKMNDNLKHFQNGALSGMVGVFISHPFDTIKACIQDGKKVPLSFRGLYRGIMSPFFGVGFEKAIVFGTYTNTANCMLERGYHYGIVNAVAGGLSGFAASFIVTPIERVKILRQTNQKVGMRDLHPNYLFRGLSATFTREMPGFAIYFSVYEGMKKHYYTDCGKEIPAYCSFLIGGLSGAVSWIFIYPQDCIKTRMQANQETHKKKFSETAKLMWKEGGIKGLYRGFHFALMRAVPLHAGTFMTMEMLKKYN